MPRKKNNAKGSTSACDDRVVSSRSSSARAPRCSSEDTPHSLRGASSRAQRGDQKEPTRTTATRKRAGPPPSLGKCQHRLEFGVTLEAEDTTVEDIGIPLTMGIFPQ